MRKNNKYGWYDSRRKNSIQGIVIQTAEGAPAQTVASYYSHNNRPESSHVVVDESNIIELLPDDYTAFHLKDYDSTTLSLTIAYWAHKWGENLQLEDLLLNNAAKWCRKKILEHDIPIKKITRDNWKRSQKGFIGPSDLEPNKRTDPGIEFPWDKFFSTPLSCIIK